jgi:predicted Zn-dependent peptidase
MLGDMIHNSLLRAADIDQERGVILEEIRMYEDNPMMQVDSLMEEELYRGSSLGRQVAGTVKSVSGLRRADLVAFKRDHYLPSRAVVAVAGKFDEATALGLVAKAFGKLPPQGRGRFFRRFDPTEVRATKPRVRIITKDTEQFQLALGFPGFGLGHPRLAAQSILNIILGGTMSSRLFVEVREKRGLAYFVRSAANAYQDVGNVSVQAGIARERLPDALAVILAELDKMKRKLVTPAELALAKDYVKGKMVLHLEESSELAEWYARQELLEGRLVPPEDKLKRLAAVTAEDVRRLAQDVFRRPRLALAVIGPTKDERAVHKALAKF